jgi:hypothetical protein
MFIKARQLPWSICSWINIKDLTHTLSLVQCCRPRPSLSRYIGIKKGSKDEGIVGMYGQRE